MNLLLSSKIRMIDPRRFFSDLSDQPCWYAEFIKADKRRQSRWKVGVKYLGEKEEHLLSLTSLDVENNDVWAKTVSEQTAIQLINGFRSGGIKAAKELLKDAT